MSYEEILYSTLSTIYSTEITHLILQEEDDWGNTEEYHAYLTEYRNSTYIMTDSNISYAFRDFEYGEVVSTR